MTRLFLGLFALSAACTATEASSSATLAPLSTAPVPITVGRYVALGDSFTAGTGSRPPQAFPARLVSHWGCTGSVMLQNLGVNGYTTDDLIESELPQLGTAADLVTLAIGANDIVHGSSSERYESQLHHIVTAIMASGARHLVAIPQPDWSLSPAAADFGAPSAIHAAIVQFNALLQKEAVAAGGIYVDLFPEMEAEAQAHMLALDGLHPSAVAYDAWGATLALRVPATCE